MSSWRFDLSSRRMTTFSPKRVGSTETLKSIVFLAPIFSFILPSWGSLLSAMSREAMIFILEVIAFFILMGRPITVLREPSRRYLTLKDFSYGSIWISLTPVFAALIRIPFTSLIIGASTSPVNASSETSSSTTSTSSIAPCTRESKSSTSTTPPVSSSSLNGSPWSLSSME